jgi:Ca2+-binding RTX toxin-like protein
MSSAPDYGWKRNAQLVCAAPAARGGKLAVLLVVPILVLAAPGTAGASDASNATEPGPGIQLQYLADPGESNGVNVRRSTNGQHYIIQDGGATITPGNGCEREFASQVRCDAADVDNFLSLLGDLPDTIDASAMDVPSHIGGREGGDFIIGSPQAERLVGNDGGDTIHGGGGSDGVEGHDGEDSVFGQDGRDDVTGGGQHDRLFGGPASDRLRGMDGSDDLFADPGADLLKGQGPNTCTDSGCGPEAPDSSERDAVSYASYSAGVRVSIDGVANDGESSGTESDNVFTDIEYVQGGSGSDTLLGSAENNIFEGMDSGDTLVGRGGRDTLFGYEGGDIFDGGGGPDSFEGGPGRDQVRYLDAPLVAGDMGVNVTVDGNPDDGNAFDEANGIRDDVGLDVEEVWGSNGQDILIGGDDANTLRGWGGGDALDGGETACASILCLAWPDTLDGGPGANDLADYHKRNVPLTITVGDGVANDGTQDEHDNVVGIENVDGGSSDDTITGNAQRNTLLGNAGADELIGGGNVDLLTGGNGPDILRGSDGDDEHFARDTEVDQVLCGPGNDDVTADTIDNVANNCENVTRG